MKPKFIFKMVVDFVMIILLIILMAYPITGNRIHMRIGKAEIVLLVLHNILNFGWYRRLFKGKYNAARIFHTAINIMTLLSMIGLIISGALLSNVFGLIPVTGMTSFSRKLHMISAYWGFVSMSLHIGLHWRMFVNMVCKNNTGIKLICLRVGACVIALYGIYSFISNRLWEYMFLKKQFVFFDESSSIVFFAQYIAIMGLCISLSHYSIKILLQKINADT